VTRGTRGKGEGLLFLTFGMKRRLCITPGRSLPEPAAEEVSAEAAVKVVNEFMVALTE
jgi:hypothetical protein